MYNPINQAILTLRMAGLAAAAARLCELDSLIRCNDDHVRFCDEELARANAEQHAALAALIQPGINAQERADAAFTVTKARAAVRQRVRSLQRALHEQRQLNAERAALQPIVDGFDPSSEPLASWLAESYRAAAAA
jgi:hypothetical protein